jgi:hypothetical protein
MTNIIISILPCTVVILRYKKKLCIWSQSLVLGTQLLRSLESLE